MRSSILENVGRGGCASVIARDNAMRTESASASSFWLPPNAMELHNNSPAIAASAATRRSA
jgi:hypothetical protein